MFIEFIGKRLDILYDVNVSNFLVFMLLGTVVGLNAFNVVDSAMFTVAKGYTNVSVLIDVKLL